MLFDKLIHQSSNTADELLKLANRLNIKVDQIDFKQYFNPNVDYCILNMGTPEIGGTHWLAVSNKDKMYFDPLALPRPKVIPRDYEYIMIDVQDIRFGHCGSYCLLWLWYLQNDTITNFFKLFKPLRIGDI